MVITDLEIFQYMETLAEPASSGEIADHFKIPDSDLNNFDIRISRLASTGNLDKHSYRDGVYVRTKYSIGAGASNALAEYQQKTRHENMMMRKASKDHKLAMFGAVTGLIGAITGLLALLLQIFL